MYLHCSWPDTTPILTTSYKLHVTIITDFSKLCWKSWYNIHRPNVYKVKDIRMAFNLALKENITLKKNGKAVPLQAWSGSEGSRKLRSPDYMTTAQDGGKVVSLMHRPPLAPGNAPGTHFCYRLSRPQGHSAMGRIMSMKNSNDTIWNRASDLPICSAVP
jgi:hypothetical protein